MTQVPATAEGWACAVLIERLGGQLRSLAGADRLVVTGIDMAGALALGAAMGIAPWLLAEVLPAIEAGIVAAHSAAREDGDDD